MEFNQEINDENNQENEKDEEQNENENDEEISIKQWFQDNLRILVSIFVVIVIAVGIYSYSNRSPQDLTTPKDQTEQGTPTNDASSKDAGKNDSAATPNANGKSTTADTANKTTAPDKNISSTTTSQETEQSFIETAGNGDSLTKLARKALADYLEKNADSTLTPEHKIYIEDYLRKNVVQKNGVHVGTSVEFSKSLIGDAIGKAKNLNAGQLKNLHKYALRVPSLN